MGLDDAALRKEPGDRGGDAAEGAEPGKELGAMTLAGLLSWTIVHGGRLQLMKDLVYVCLADFGMHPIKGVQEKQVIQEVIRR